MAALGYVLLVSFMLSVVSSAVFSGKQSHNGSQATSNEGCYYNNIFYKVGESWSDPKFCSNITCFEGGGYEGKTCGKTVLSPGSPCHITEDLSKPYPDCCQKIVCP